MRRSAVINYCLTISYGTAVDDKTNHFPFAILYLPFVIAAGNRPMFEGCWFGRLLAIRNDKIEWQTENERMRKNSCGHPEDPLICALFLQNSFALMADNGATKGDRAESR
jgi:hypothetical protein